MRKILMLAFLAGALQGSSVLADELADNEYTTPGTETQDTTTYTPSTYESYTDDEATTYDTTTTGE